MPQFAMTERDILLQAGLDEAVAAIDEATSSLGCRFVITDFGHDHRTGHVEREGVAEFYVVLMMSDASRTVARMDVRGELGQSLVRALDDLHPS
jgi:hypothetical protein